MVTKDWFETRKGPPKVHHTTGLSTICLCVQVCICVVGVGVSVLCVYMCVFVCIFGEWLYLFHLIQNANAEVLENMKNTVHEKQQHTKKVFFFCFFFSSKNV